MRKPVFALVGSLFFVQAALADSSARLYHGTFRDADVVVTLAIDDTGNAYDGNLALKGQTLPVAHATATGPTLQGTFQTPAGGAFPFTLAWDHYRMTFKTGSATHTLVPDAPAQLVDYQADPDYAALQQANAAINEKNYDRAQQLVAPLVLHKSARGLFLKGVLAFWGWGEPKNFDAAIAMYRRAAALGDPTGLRNAALDFKAGDGTPKDSVAARGFFEDGLRLGDADCALELGVLYVNGDGVPQDLARGYSYYALSNLDKARQNMAELERKFMKPDAVAAGKAGLADLRREIFPQANKPQPAVAAARPFPIEFTIDASGHAVVKSKPTAESFTSIEPGDVLVRLNDRSDIGVVTADQLKQILADADRSDMVQVELRRGDSGVQVVAPR